jgi:PPK2 family polyphosphate:nucleotide phosphotransferase
MSAVKSDGKKAIHLNRINPQRDGGLSREAGDARLNAALEEITRLQELLYAAQETPLLIILQGMDTSGKDGTIRSVIGSMNPGGCDVASFKVPTPHELAHDFLWRIHPHAPGKGQVVIFNRSHYEDVLVVRVKNLVPEAVWRKRYEQINEFERLLTENGTVILKFFLHITKDEQEERLLAREQDPAKAWKLSVEDWKNREFWDDYMAAYEDAINACSTPDAPWHVIPANKKWYRNVLVAETIAATLQTFEQGWNDKLKTMGETEKKELWELRQAQR